MPTNKQFMMTSGLIALGAVIVAWLFALPGWLAALLGAALMLIRPWQILQDQRKSIQASQASARTALHESSQPLLMLDIQGKTVLANPAFLALAQPATEAPAGELVSVLPEAWRQFIAELHQHTLAKGCGSTEALLPNAAGHIQLRAHGLSLTAPDGAPRVLLLWENLSGHHVTLDRLLEREQALLTRSQAFVQTLIDVIPQAVYIKRFDGAQSRYTQVNTAFCALHNRSRKELLETTASHVDLINDPARASMLNQEDLRVLDGMSVFREEESVDEQTGKARFTIVCKQACEDAEGHAVIVGTNFDITPWRMAERNLKQVLQREVNRREQVQSFVQRLIDMIPYPVHVKDARCRYLMVNEAFVRERGRSREQLLGKDPLEVIKLMLGERLEAQDTERQRALLSLEEDHKVLAGEFLIKEEQSTHSVTGVERFRTVYKGGCLDAEGQPVIVTAFFDVTKWRLAEHQLAEALGRETALLARTQAFTQRLIDLIPDEFYVKDADSRFMLVNQAFLNRRLIPTREEVIGHSMEEITLAMCKADPAYRDQPELLAGVIADHMERIKVSREEDLLVLAGQNLQKEDHHILPHSGEERFFLVAKSAATDVEGRPAIVCLNFNITAQRQAERKVREFEAGTGV